MTEHDIQLLKSHFTFWDKLSPHQKDILIGGTTAVSYERGDSIHSADLDCVGVLLIKKGSVRVYILSEDGRVITLYRCMTETSVFYQLPAFFSQSHSMSISMPFPTVNFFRRIPVPFHRSCRKIFMWKPSPTSWHLKVSPTSCGQCSRCFS